MTELYDLDENEYSVFSGVGVLVKEAQTEEESYKLPIIGAYRYKDGNGDSDLLVVVTNDPPTKNFPVDVEESTTDPNTGTITFSVFDSNYIIRKLEEADSSWLSPGGEALSVEELEKLVQEKGL